MTSTERIWMTRRDYTRWRSILNALRIRVGHADDSTYRDANIVALKRRIRSIQDLLTNAIIDDERTGDSIAEPGMVLTIRYDGTSETETFLLGRAWRRRFDSQDADIKVYSTLSPMGRAVSGARPGDQRIYSIPNRSARLVTLLEAVPYRTYVANKSRLSSGQQGRQQPSGEERNS